ncbi:hypothetical protein [Asticcacaulis sp. YBE204]|uniref:hypothetical protein n=1 Tax=Asticcacaulis sp. YBE204 TaxID=1282363 RepID=UPI0003C3ECFC|nr:hypothetical protein [Asticcacaulis sp. YBE204]ESQ80469.1 hypothetical protein AEYBE204_04170 [Asticcacaulis sp. YBE204]
MCLNQLLPQADAIEAIFEDDVRFFDPGSNWSGVTCNLCGEDAESWFFDSMEAASESGFRDLTTTAPCCGGKVDLNRLNYVWQSAFGRFAIEVLNPGVVLLSSEQVETVSRALQSDITEVWAHI